METVISEVQTTSQEKLAGLDKQRRLVQPYPPLQQKAGTEAGSSQQQPPPTPPVVVLSSTGPSAEYFGDCLGVFDYVQQYNNSPAYTQRDTKKHRSVNLYRDDNGDWSKMC